MNNQEQRLSDYLEHILESIERIESYVADIDEVGFLKNKLVQDAVIRNFEIIGEASRNIERYHSQFAESHAYLPLGFAYEMRNALSHGYFKVDLEIVWNTIHTNLPKLHEQIKQLLKQISSSATR